MNSEKYVFVNKNKIIKVSQRMLNSKSTATYADKDYAPISDYKELVIDEKPDFDEATETLLSWFENSDDVITQRFKVIKDKEGVSG